MRAPLVIAGLTMALLVPASAASASTGIAGADHGYGNCGNNASTGVPSASDGPGYGGFVKNGVKPKLACLGAVAPTPPGDAPVVDGADSF